MAVYATQKAIKPLAVVTALGAALALTVFTGVGQAHAAPGDDGFLGDAEDYSVIAYATVTNSGADTLLDQGLALTPGTQTPGLAPIAVVGGNVVGAFDVANANALDAQADADVAALALMTPTPYVVGAADLAGFTYVAGRYSSATNLNNTGVMTLQGDEDDVFIFTAVDGLTFGPGASVAFIGNAQACNVFWRIGSSAEIQTGADFVGTLIAYASVAVGTDASIDGRLIAQTGEVTLLNNVFTSSPCDRISGDGSRTGPVGTVAGSTAPFTTVAVVTPPPTTPPTTTGTTGTTPRTSTSRGNRTLAFTGSLANTGVAAPEVPTGGLVGAALALLLGTTLVILGRRTATLRRH